MRQRFDVKAAAADDDGQLSPCVNSTDGAKRELPEFFRVHFLQDRHRPDQMMRNFGERGGVRLGREEIKSGIDLERVGINDFCIEIPRHIRGELGFSDSGRTNDEKCSFHESVCRASL